MVSMKICLDIMQAGKALINLVNRFRREREDVWFDLGDFLMRLLMTPKVLWRPRRMGKLGPVWNRGGPAGWPGGRPYLRLMRPMSRQKS